MKRITALLSITTTLLVGCAATGPTFSPAPVVDPDATNVYIYRRTALALGGRAVYVFINDVNVFDLNSGGYSWVSLPAGDYKLTQKWGFDMLAKPLVLDIQVKPKQVRYFSFETNLCNGGYKEICLGWRLREESPEVGSAEIQKAKFQENFGAAKLSEKLGQALPK